MNKRQYKKLLTKNKDILADCFYSVCINIVDGKTRFKDFNSEFIRMIKTKTYYK